MPIVTIITDFGLGDPYVAMMKGRMLSIGSTIKFVDVTHEIECGDVIGASFLLEKTYRYFPKGSVHLIVVDPTVGSARRAIFTSFQNHFFVGPDNGVLSPVLSETYRINKGSDIEPRTFEGRDIFAPIAARLAIGEDPICLGERIDNPVRFKLPEPEIKDNRIIGEIIHIDHFGNLISNISGDMFSGKRIDIEICGKKITGLSGNYSEKKDNKLTALINGGFKLLEVAINKGSAASYLNCKKGERITIRRKDE
ncbi:SAM-dependent chlorinase/fluorinase [candidate division WOR-3 bacterium]|nr:SAM-dependent chlorinase/fluorinase [candidate division WOR-3 bacterium]